MANLKTIQKPNSKLAMMILAGIVGTIAFDASMYADIAITGVQLDIIELMGILTVGESEYAQIVGHVVHFVNGIGLALLFGYVALPISKKIIKLPIIVYALAFSLIENTIAVWLVMLPLLGAGIAGVNIAPEVALMTFSRHIIFGVVLGGVFGLVLRKESTK
ncbi:MAG: hypothetical protein K5798_02990 [Nitrosopumilus sp.]|uniref:DUF6789 family protein n=1 Tax=Nitrosopumilus sp. TaxID=2024843 RepID=UPI00242F7A88|nr:DUF6789 family protein [Nitrosopumilus sp.]MCV0366216.1 hypothetical protein [Nitrosopumilus sp.]